MSSIGFLAMLAATAAVICIHIGILRAYPEHTRERTIVMDIEGRNSVFYMLLGFAAAAVLDMAAHRLAKRGREQASGRTDKERVNPVGVFLCLFMPYAMLPYGLVLIARGYRREGEVFSITSGIVLCLLAVLLVAHVIEKV